TGAASGIGAAIAEAFAREGAQLALADVGDEGLDRTLRAVQAIGARAIAGRVDVTRSAGVEAFVRRTVDELGALDFGINCAGVGPRVAPLADCTEDEFDRVMAVNTRGVWLCM